MWKNIVQTDSLYEHCMNCITTEKHVNFLKIQAINIPNFPNVRFCLLKQNAFVQLETTRTTLLICFIYYLSVSISFGDLLSF